jgi:hypothetical protein
VKKLAPVGRAKTIPININTLIGAVLTLIGGIVLYMLTSFMGQTKEQTKSLTTITTSLPFMQKSIDATAADVKEANKDLKEAKAVMVTRNELNEKHARLQDAIKDVKLEVNEVKIEQSKVRDDLIRQKPNPK